MAELLTRISARELREWQAYWQIEPFGTWRDDLHAARIEAAIYNVNRDPEKQPDPFGPPEFMLKTRRRTQPARKSAEDIYDAFRAWAAAHKQS